MVLPLEDMRRGSFLQSQQQHASAPYLILPRSDDEAPPPGPDAITDSVRNSGCAGTLPSLQVRNSAACCHHQSLCVTATMVPFRCVQLLNSCVPWTPPSLVPTRAPRHHARLLTTGTYSLASSATMSRGTVRESPPEDEMVEVLLEEENPTPAYPVFTEAMAAALAPLAVGSEAIITGGHRKGLEGSRVLILLILPSTDPCSRNVRLLSGPKDQQRRTLTGCVPPGGQRERPSSRRPRATSLSPMAAEAPHL